MAWSVEWESFLDGAPWPALKDELVDYALRSGGPGDLTDYLEGLPDDGRAYESVAEVAPTSTENIEFFETE